VVSGRVGQRIALTRNAAFHQWSALAQPNGYPDRIEITLVKSENGSSSATDNDAVAKGKYDWTPDELEPDQLPSYLVNRTEQLHPFGISSTHFYVLNTREKPFTDARVRRAVNFAIDRRAVANAFGGQLLAVPTCQALPPNISGYRPYCPFTLHPNSSGVWSAPDIDQGRRLVRAAHATGAKVTVWARPDHYDLGDIVVRAMRQIGLDATVHRFPDLGQDTGQRYFDAVNDLSHHVQASFDGWAVDYPAPSNLLNVLFRCSSISTGDSLNAAAFCDHGIDVKMDKALQQQATDPAGAGAAWADIDQAISYQAPWVFLENDRSYDVLASRVGNYQRNPQWGVLIDQLWVQ
jgi:peptide/nickel transport system substrate-binding protein